METPEQRPPFRRPLFTARATHVVRIAGLGLVLTAGAAGLTTYSYFHSPYWNRVGIAAAQPVMFSHRHHVGELRIDCRFCHTTVETSADAGLPSTQTCLTCHSQLFHGETMLQPVIASAEKNTPLAWSRVNTLPDHVHFNHSIHLAKGIACVSCHGDVGTMALTAKARSLTMRECLECHRNPQPQQVTNDRIFTTRQIDRETAGNQITAGPARVNADVLMNCSTCHH